MENYSLWYSKINPNFTVPSIRYVDKDKNIDVRLTDSKDIIFFLAKMHPEKNLIPNDLAIKNKINDYVSLFYDRYSQIIGFTLLNIMNWGLTYRLFVIKGKLLYTNYKLS